MKEFKKFLKEIYKITINDFLTKLTTYQQAEIEKEYEIWYRNRS